MQLRPYQKEAVEAIYAHLRTRDDNPCVVLPTGTGKSLVIAQIATDAVTRWNGRVLVLAHVKELLEQNADKIRKLCPGLKIGVYSAGLKQRDTDNDVIVAGIQSIYKRACELGSFDLIVVDEAHLIQPDGEGRYRQFLSDAKVVNPNVRVIGLTATPYRLKGGLICQPENILNHVCYEAGIKEMIVQGYLCKLHSRGGRVKADLSGLHLRGGEFIASEMEAAMDETIDGACREIIELTQDRHSVLIFTTSVKHCRRVAKRIEELSGTECGIVTGDTPSDERAEILARFKREPTPASLFHEVREPLKFLANVNVLTTGFDATNVDCVVLLRPTASVGLYVQMIGRGTRLHLDKEDCLILDYGGNVLRHGPVDAVTVSHKTPGAGGEAPAKECPECYALIHAAYRRCPYCDFEFPPPQTDLDKNASNAGIISGEVTENDYEVEEVSYTVHTKRGATAHAPKTLRIEYKVGFNQWISEWVCPEHSGWARQKFEKWWSARSSYPPPETAGEAVALANDGALADTLAITVHSVAGERFDRITDYELGEKPEDYAPEPGWNDQIDENGLLPSDNWEEIPF